MSKALLVVDCSSNELAEDHRERACGYQRFPRDDPRKSITDRRSTLGPPESATCCHGLLSNRYFLGALFR